MYQRRPTIIEGKEEDERTVKDVKLHDTRDVMTTRKMAKRFFFSASYIVFYLVLNLIFVLAVIAVVAAVMDIHPQWKRASRMVELEVSQAAGTISSSTCKYYAGVLSKDDKAKWEASALAETNKKCVDAEIVANQWVFWMKVRHVLYTNYVMWNPGEFWPFLKDSLLYIMSVFMALLPFLSQIIGWARPIATAHRAFGEDP